MDVVVRIYSIGRDERVYNKAKVTTTTHLGGAHQRNRFGFGEDPSQRCVTVAEGYWRAAGHGGKCCRGYPPAHYLRSDVGGKSVWAPPC